MSDFTQINQHLAKLLRLIRLPLNPNDPPRLLPQSHWVIKQSREVMGSRPEVATEPLIKLGNIEYGLGEFVRAVEYFTRAANQANEDGDDRLTDVALRNLGVAQLASEQSDAAIRTYDLIAERAALISEAPTQRLEAMINKATALRRADRLDDARATLEEVCRVAAESGFPDLEAKCWMDLSLFDYANGETRAAIQKLRRALDLYAMSGNIADQLRAYYNIALVYADSGDRPAAIRHLEHALTLQREHKIEYGDELISKTLEEMRSLSDSGAS